MTDWTRDKVSLVCFVIAEQLVLSTRQKKLTNQVQKAFGSISNSSKREPSVVLLWQVLEGSVITQNVQCIPENPETQVHP